MAKEPTVNERAGCEGISGAFWDGALLFGRRSVEIGFGKVGRGKSGLKYGEGLLYGVSRAASKGEKDAKGD